MVAILGTKDLFGRRKYGVLFSALFVAFTPMLMGNWLAPSMSAQTANSEQAISARSFDGQWEAIDNSGQVFWVINISSGPDGLQVKYRVADFDFDSEGKVVVPAKNSSGDWKDEHLATKVEQSGSELIIYWSAAPKAGDWHFSVVDHKSAELIVTNDVDSKDASDLNHLKPIRFRRRA